jgi:hypothetical protein
MKMRCTISTPNWENTDTHETVQGPKKGEIVTVVGEISDFGYELKEYSCPDSWGWEKRHFVPVDFEDITEQLVRELKIVDEVPDIEEIKELCS